MISITTNEHPIANHTTVHVIHQLYAVLDYFTDNVVMCVWTEPINCSTHVKKASLELYKRLESFSHEFRYIPYSFEMQLAWSYDEIYLVETILELIDENDLTGDLNNTVFESGVNHIDGLRKMVEVMTSKNWHLV